MTDRDVMQQALDALVLWQDEAPYAWSKADADAITALRTALEQQAEPVAWRYRGNLHEFDPSDWAAGEVIPLYTAPPQREWHGLTDEDLEFWTGELSQGELGRGVIRAVADHLKERNT